MMTKSQQQTFELFTFVSERLNKVGKFKPEKTISLYMLRILGIILFEENL